MERVSKMAAERAVPVRGVLGRALEPLYRAAVAVRNRRYDAGRGVRRLTVPVISVGNISVGGTGKTPMTAWVVRTLADAGVQAAVALRGYSKSGPHGEQSDEAQEYRRTLPGVPIAAGPRRHETVSRLAGTPAWRGVRCVVMDDGFQHRGLARDLDIVLIDATRSPFDDRLLPAGWLREPVSSLGRAGVVLMTHAESAEPGAVERIDAGLMRVRGRPAEAVSRHAWTGLRVSEPPYETDRMEPVTWLADKNVMAVCGIGNPGPFVRMVRDASRACQELVFEDHETYAPGTVAGSLVRSSQFFRDALRRDPIVTTEKDWSKLHALAPGAWSGPVARPVLEMRFDRGEQALREAVLRAAGAGPQ